MKPSLIYNPQGIPILGFRLLTNGTYEVFETSSNGNPKSHQSKTYPIAEFKKMLADTYDTGAYTDNPSLDFEITSARNPSVNNNSYVAPNPTPQIVNPNVDNELIPTTGLKGFSGKPTVVATYPDVQAPVTNNAVTPSAQNTPNANPSFNYSDEETVLPFKPDPNAPANEEVTLPFSPDVNSPQVIFDKDNKVIGEWHTLPNGTVEYYKEFNAYGDPTDNAEVITRDELKKRITASGGKPSINPDDQKITPPNNNQKPFTVNKDSWALPNPATTNTNPPVPTTTGTATTIGVAANNGNNPPAPAPTPNKKYKDQQTFYLIDKDGNSGMHYREMEDGSYRVYPNKNNYGVYNDVSRADLENIILEEEKKGFEPLIPERNKLFKMDRKTPEGIREIQRQLGVPPTGVIDDPTTAAIIKHQTDNGLKVDGIAGPRTIGSIEKNKAKAAAEKAAANPQTTPTIVDPNADKADPNKKVDLAPITNTTTDATGNPVTTTKLEGDTNGDGIVDEEDVVLVEPSTPEIATNSGSFNTSPFTRRVTHGIWEPFGNDEDSSMEYRTRPIKRLYTNPQRQDTSTATVVNEFLGKTFGSREDRQERRDNRRYENDRRNDREDTRNKTNDKADDEKILEGKEEKVRRRGPLFQNPMIDVARNVVNGKEKMPEFDNVRDARQFHRAVKQAQTFIRREDAADNKAHNRNAAKYDRDQEKLREIRRKTEERLGIKYQTPNSPSQGNTSLPTSPTIAPDQQNSKGVLPPNESPIMNYNANPTPDEKIEMLKKNQAAHSDMADRATNAVKFNSTFQNYEASPTKIPFKPELKQNPLYRSFDDLKVSAGYGLPREGVMKPEEFEKYQESQKKQSGGQIMQDGSRINRPLFDIKMSKQNNANWKLDGLDELPEYRFNEEQSKKNLYESVVGRRKYGRNTDVGYTPQSKTNLFTDFSKYSQDKFGLPKASKLDLVPDPINFIEGTDGSKKTTTTQSGSTGAPYWNSRKLNVFGNQMQHEANMYPVMYNVGKSLFDKAEVQNPTYNKQDVAFLQGMKRNQIGLNMNPINDNRAAMNQAIRGNARGSGQILNAYAAAQNTASKNMNDEMYRVKNANQAQENNYLQALSQVGSNRREIDTLVDEKNRQHRLSFEKFQRDALESGEKAQINKGQMINQELSDKITMDNYLNQIGKNFQYKLQGDGTYMIEFEDFSGNKRKMSPYQTKATMEIMQKAEQDKQNTKQAELNAQAAADEKLKQIALTEEQRAKLKAYEDAEIRAAKEKKWNDEQAAKAKAEADAKAKGTNKTGGYIYKRKSF